MLKEEEKNRIARILSERMNHFTCPVCGRGNLTLLDGYSSQGIGDDYQNIVLADKIIPYVMLVCNNCGFISHHALGTLGLLNKKDDDK